jgi:hypothetical protein
MSPSHRGFPISLKLDDAKASIAVIAKDRKSMYFRGLRMLDLLPPR